MAAMGSYDSSLQMFVQTPREVDMIRLNFMRWLAEQGRLEQRVHGAVSGVLKDGYRRRSQGGESVSPANLFPRSTEGRYKFDGFEGAPMDAYQPAKFFEGNLQGGIFKERG